MIHGTSGFGAWVRQADVGASRPTHGPLTSDEKAELARLRREFKTVTMERDCLTKRPPSSPDRKMSLSSSRWRGLTTRTQSYVAPSGSCRPAT